LRIKGTDKALSVSTDGNGRLCYLDPRRGSERLVYEAALNVAVTGAKPLAVVDNLNFGNPEKPEVMWQFTESVEGISMSCEELGIPVVGGNVSFYNETDGVDINPTPVVGLLGLADPMPSSPPRLDRAAEGMEIWEIGPSPTDNLAGSAVQRIQGSGLIGRPTEPDPATARQVIDVALDLAHTASVLHDVSDGGIAVAIAEICIASGVGAEVTIDDPVLLFSEDPHRLVAVLDPETFTMEPELGRRLGTIGGDEIRFGPGVIVKLGDVTESWNNAIPDSLFG
jgi:phosphoribosylformylglycinamidine synthase